MSDQLTITSRTRVRRKPERSHYDRQKIDEVIDHSFLGVIAFTESNQVHAIPTLIWRVNNHLYIHGSHGSRLLKNLLTGIEVCVSITILDGIVLARSAMAHSMNYRSVCIYGQFKEVSNDRKKHLFEKMFENWLPGRWQYLRQPTEKELNSTQVLELAINEAVLKTRQGDVTDYLEDMEHPVWAGVIPIIQKYLSPQQTPVQINADLPGLPKIKL